MTSSQTPSQPLSAQASSSSHTKQVDHDSAPSDQPHLAVRRAPYDLFVIGGGSGGVRAARWAASRGLRVGIAEGARYGGTCVNVGCVPKKLFFHASHYAEQLSDMSGFGWSLERQPRHDWGTLTRNIDAHITKLNKIYERLLDNTGVERFAGWATFESEHHVRVDYPGDTEAEQPSELIEARHTLIATGGRPSLPEIEGIEEAKTSDDFFALETRPTSALVVGGGYIGVEIAGVLSGLGTETTLIFRGDRPLRAFDDDVSVRLEQALRRQMEVRAQCQVRKIERIERGDQALKRVYLDDDSTLEVEEVFFMTGRVPNTARLNLARLNIEVDAQGAIIVDEEYRSSVPHIFAVGDVINKLQLTPVALAEGMRVVGTLCGEPMPPLNYDLVPTTVFSHPNVGVVGLSEQEARARGHDVTVYEADFRPMQQAFEAHPRRVYMKLIVDARTDLVLGCHMIGDEAGEQLQGLAAAMQAKITKTQLDQTVGIHPTMAEEWVTMRTPRADSTR